MLDRKAYFIREHVGFMKLTDTYDILDPDSGRQIGVAKERVPGYIHALRLLVGKQFLPTAVHVHEGADHEDGGTLLFSIRRGVAFLRSRVEIRDRQGALVGWFTSKLFSFGGAFQVFDASGAEVALVKGDWKGWNFRFLAGEAEIGTVTKQWAGIGKELFTSADQYVIALHQPPSPARNTLLLAAGLAVDIIYKER